MVAAESERLGRLYYADEATVSAIAMAPVSLRELIFGDGGSVGTLPICVIQPNRSCGISFCRHPDRHTPDNSSGRRPIAAKRAAVQQACDGGDRGRGQRYGWGQRHRDRGLADSALPPRAGEVRAIGTNGRTFVQADLTGNGSIDFEILLGFGSVGSTSLTEDNFVLSY